MEQEHSRKARERERSEQKINGLAHICLKREHLKQRRLACWNLGVAEGERVGNGVCPAGIRARRKCGALHLVAAKAYSREEIWQSVARLGCGLKRERRSGAHIKQKRGKAQTGLSVLPEERRIKRRAMSLGEGHNPQLRGPPVSAKNSQASWR